MYEQYFFAENNFKLIMSVLYDHFKNNEEYIIKKDEEELCIKVMEYVYENNKKEKNETIKQYITRLNKNVLVLSIKIIMKQVQKQKEEKKILMTKDELKKEYKKIIEEREPLEKKINRKEIEEKIEEKKEEINNEIIKDKFEKMNKEREEEKEKIEKNLNNQIIGMDLNNNKQEEIIQMDVPQASGKDLLIQQPKEFKELIDNSYKYNNNYIKTDYLTIDSRDRNHDSYPETNNYQIDLDDNYKDILSIELISCNIPKSQYIINTSNNKLHFSENGGTELEAIIPIGNYSINDLETAIKNAMESVGTDTYTITTNNLTNKITITKSTGTLELFFNGGTEKYNNETRTIYKENSIAEIIGFKRLDLSGSLTYTGQYQYNLYGPTYLILHIDELYNLDGIKSSIKKSFAKIPFDNNQHTYKFFKEASDYIVKTEFSPPLAKLSQLNIRFLNYNGTEYDFSGLEHSFLFKIKRLNQSQGYFIN